MYILSQDRYDKLGYDLASELATFTEAMRVHAYTEGIPAPTADPLVEDIYYRHGGEFEIRKAKRYYKVVDGIIVDKGDFLETPDSPWVEVTGQNSVIIGYVWNEERQAFVSPEVAAQPIPEPLTKDQEISEIRQTMTGIAETFLQLQARLEVLETNESGGNQ